VPRVSVNLTGAANLHFICDFPSTWEHAGAWMILGEHVDGLSEPLELASGEGDSERFRSPLLRLVDGSQSRRLRYRQKSA